MAGFCCHGNATFNYEETNLRVYTTNMQSFITIHSQTNTQCFSECDYPVCWQTSQGSLKPALLQHSGTVVQKGLTMLHGFVHYFVQKLFKENGTRPAAFSVEGTLVWENCDVFFCQTKVNTLGCSNQKQNPPMFYYYSKPCCSIEAKSVLWVAVIRSETDHSLVKQS